jgi:Na+/melibiose symporter-like transporter
MIPAAALLGAVLLGVAAMTWGGTIGWPLFLGTWLVLGVAYSAVQTPTGRLLRRSATPENRPAVFAAQFALSHAAWLLTYPLAGWLGPSVGMPSTLAILGAVTLAGVATAARLWPAAEPDVIEHAHADLDVRHPHLHGGRRHAHVYVIDDLHHRWPARAG